MATNSRPLRCLLVDDEPLALDILRHYLARIPTLELAATAASAPEAFAILASQPIDLLFCDIQMPGITGMQLVRGLANPPLIVFTTAHPAFAVESYEVNALDYFLKPIPFERFQLAVHRAEEKLRLRQPAEPAPEAPAQSDILLLRADKKLHTIPYADILYVESLSDYIRIHTPGGPIVSYLTISGLEQQLPSDRFLRIHRSYIVPTRRIRAISATEVQLEGLTLPVGRSFKERVQEYLRRQLNA